MAESVKVGGSVMWACTNKPNEMSGKYQFDLCNLSKAACTALENLGISVKEKEDKPEIGAYITLKSSRPIRMYNPDGSIIEDDIGNGSKAQVVVGYYDWTFKGKKGRSPSQNKVVITELKIYSPEGSEENEDDMVL